jgi:hypothetical protein
VNTIAIGVLNTGEAGSRFSEVLTTATAGVDRWHRRARHVRNCGLVDTA